MNNPTPPPRPFNFIRALAVLIVQAAHLRRTDRAQAEQATTTAPEPRHGETVKAEG